MKPLSICTATLALALVSHWAHAASSSQITVGGRITPAGSCTPTLSASQLDFGAISTSQFESDGPTVLPEKPVTLTVNCQSPTWLDIRFIDHKSGDAVPLRHPLCQESPICKENAMGLARDARNQKIGALFVFSGQNGGMDGDAFTWWQGSVGSSMHFRKSPQEPFSAEAKFFYSPQRTNNSPQGRLEAKHFVLPFKIAPIIDSQHLVVTDEVQINGALSIELQAL